MKSGQVMHATVHKVNDFGLVVKLSPKIKAVCPSLHASDVGMTAVQLKKKFKTGQVIKVRVWEAKECAMIVTHKRSLVEDADAPILSYDDIMPGDRESTPSRFILSPHPLNTSSQHTLSSDPL